MSHFDSLIPVVLCGGTGSRLWPLSTPECPKPFADLLGTSLFRLTLRRLHSLDTPLIVATHALAALIRRNLADEGLAHATVLLEPRARGTAPAICHLVLDLLARGHGKRTCILFPADHLIRETDVLADALRLAARHAAAGRLVVIGTVPGGVPPGPDRLVLSTIPRTTGQTGVVSGVHALEAAPDAHHAGRLHKRHGPRLQVATGIYAFRPDHLAAAYHRFSPTLWRALSEARRKDRVATLYKHLNAKSFEQEIVRHLTPDQLLCVPTPDMGWQDLGTFSSLLTAQPPRLDPQAGDDSTNAVLGIAGKTYVLRGVSGLLIVDTPNGLLVTPRPDHPA